MVPKIKISTSRKREKNNLNCTTSTTSNFGSVQPTFCREMLPGSKFTMKTASRVLLSGMPVPTFGNIFMKNYHVFVPYSDVCPQFNSFIANQPYSPSTGVSFYPNQLPELLLEKISQYVLAKWADYSLYPITSESANQVTWTPVTVDAVSKSLTDVKAAWDAVVHPTLTAGDFMFFSQAVSAAFRTAAAPMSLSAYGDYGFSLGGERHGRLLLGDYYCSANNIQTSSELSISTGALTDNIFPTESYTVVTPEDADYISEFGYAGSRYYACFKLTAVGKRIRQILIGLGYQFTPNVPKSANWLKLLAFYKSWFNIFRPKRDLAFQNTTCYNLIKLMENPESTVVDLLYDVQGGSSGVPGNSYCPTSIVRNFIDELGLDCYYYLPLDYFSMAVVSPNANYQGDNNVLYVPTYVNQQGIIANANLQSGFVNSVNDSSKYPNIGSGYTSLSVLSLAERVLRFVNKNTVIGRSVYDFVKAHFGITLDDSHDLETVYVIGQSSTTIEISELMNSAATSEMELGEFAGRGIGHGKSEEFTFENRDVHGVWITLTTIIPDSGFYQGVLKENTARNRYDFFTPEFDAAGYQVLERSEVSLDYPVSIAGFRPRLRVSPNSAFGFVPRYSHVKVGRNIVNGDLSLRGLRNSMAGYTLDRMIPYDRMGVGRSATDGLVTYPVAPLYSVTQVSDSFRQVDPTDHLGDYNRIFYYSNNDVDHFIINLGFAVTGWLPAISLSESFDTNDGSENITEIEHS